MTLLNIHILQLLNISTHTQLSQTLQVLKDLAIEKGSSSWLVDFSIESFAWFFIKQRCFLGCYFLSILLAATPFMYHLTLWITLFCVQVEDSQQNYVLKFKISLLLVCQKFSMKYAWNHTYIQPSLVSRKVCSHPNIKV